MGQHEANFWQARFQHVASKKSVRPSVSEEKSEEKSEENMMCGVCGTGDTEEQLEERVREQTEKVIDLEIEAEESIVPKGFSRVYVPRREEFDNHCLTHLPYRSWCPICVQIQLWL